MGVNQLRVTDLEYGNRALYVELHQDRSAVLRENDPLRSLTTGYGIDLDGTTIADSKECQAPNTFPSRPRVRRQQIGTVQALDYDPGPIRGNRDSFRRRGDSQVLNRTKWPRGQ